MLHTFIQGTKMDLREDKETLQLLCENSQSPVKREVASKLAHKIRAVRYMECSALTQRGLKQVRYAASLSGRKDNGVSSKGSGINPSYNTDDL